MSKKLLIIVAIISLVLAGTGIMKLVQADQPETRILTLCDSITQAGQYQAELSRLLTLENIPHQIFNAGVGSTGVEYWATNVTAAMNTYQPDVVLLNCGTNDTWTVTHDLNYFNAKYRTVVENILNWRTPNRVKLFASYIAYGMPPANQTFINNQPAVNNAIYTQLPIYGGMITGVADFQQIPPNGLYLDGTGYHPTARGYKAMGRIWYDAMRTSMGWAVSSEPPLCGMDGAPMITGYARRLPIACAGQ